MINLSSIVAVICTIVAKLLIQHSEDGRTGDDGILNFVHDISSGGFNLLQKKHLTKQF